MHLLFVVERPTQFEAPFYRHAAGDPGHRFEVLFTTPEPAAEVFDPELGREVRWGIDLISGYPWRAPERPGGSRGVRRLLARALDRGRPDLVIVNGYTRPGYLAAALLARRRGVPVALRTDSVLWPDRRRPPLAKRLLVRGPLGALYRLFLTTGTLGRRFLAACGLPPERIALFPYAVDVEHFRNAAALAPAARAEARAALGLPAGARVVLAVAKMSAREAPWDLVRAFATLDGGDLRLLLVGDGPERARLEAFAGERLGGRAVFAGYVPYPGLPRLYGVSDLFVHPAAEERWGVSVAEALAAGLPAVASSRVGAAYDLVRPGENGFLYRAGDPGDLAPAVDAALALEPRAVREANRAILAAHDYRASWEGLLEGAARVVRATAVR